MDFSSSNSLNYLNHCNIKKMFFWRHIIFSHNKNDWCVVKLFFFFFFFFFFTQIKDVSFSFFFFFYKSRMYFSHTGRNEINHTTIGCATYSAPFISCFIVI